MTSTKTKYWYDLEFLEDGKTILPISIGVVCEDDRKYYAVNSEINESENSSNYKRIIKHKWLMESVIPHLPVKEHMYTSPGSSASSFFSLDMRSPGVKPWWVIRNELEVFFSNGNELPTLWSWCGAYDHVALCQAWGTMMNRPRFMPMFTNDLQQEMDRLDISDAEVTREALGIYGRSHNALDDAVYHKAIWEKIQEVEAAQKMTGWEEGYSSSVRSRSYTTTLNDAVLTTLENSRITLDNALNCLRTMRSYLPDQRISDEGGLPEPSMVNVRQVINLLEGNHKNDFSNHPLEGLQIAEGIEGEGK